MTARRNQASSLTPFPVGRFTFDPKDKLSLGFSYFRGMYSGNPNFFGSGFSSKSFAFFVLFGRKYRLLRGLVFYLRLEFESLESSSSWVFCMLARKNLLALIDIVLTFEWRILIPRIIYYGPAVPLRSTNQRYRSSPLTAFEQVMLLRSSSCGF
jgi:hypothetical protein